MKMCKDEERKEISTRLHRRWGIRWSGERTEMMTLLKSENCFCSTAGDLSIYILGGE